MALLARIVPCWLIVITLVIGSVHADDKKKPAVKEVPAAKVEEKTVEAKKPEAKKADGQKAKEVKAPAKPAAAKVEPKKPEAKPTPKPAPKPVAPVAVKKEAPKTHTVKKDRLKIDLNLQGVVQATNERAFTLRPKVWQVWRVVKAALPGTAVKKGSVILQFDTRGIDEAIQDVEAGQAYSDLTYQAAQQELNFLEETVPLDMALAERNKKYFDQDYKYYFEKELPLAREVANKNLERYEDMLAYEKEEMRQLEKMYKADDLTEETEEIILKRQRDTVKRLEFFLVQAKQLRDRTIEKSIPREELSTKDNAKIAELRLRSARMAYPRMLAQKRLELQQLTRNREKAHMQLKNLKADRAMMAIQTPIDGVIYYGGHTRGVFSNSAAVAPMLLPNVVVKPGTTLMTIVSPRPVILRTAVSESLLRFAKKGIAGRVTPVAFPDMRINAKIAAVSSVPLTPGSFDVLVALDAGTDNNSLLPGMNATAKLTAYDKKDALVVPPTTVHTDENDDTKFYVYLAEANGKSKKAWVSVGHRTKTKVEITKGLKEGDKVLLEKPSK